jgi:hypothetical protein
MSYDRKNERYTLACNGEQTTIQCANHVQHGSDIKYNEARALLSLVISQLQERQNLSLASAAAQGNVLAFYPSLCCRFRVFEGFVASEISTGSSFGR